MQTFLPHPDFRESAKVLDRQRLGKQRVESYQILRTLVGISNGWKNHPAVKMWRGHEGALIRYFKVMCEAWVDLGYKDSCWINWIDQVASMNLTLPLETWHSPSWLGDEAFHASHRSNLLRKDPVHYGTFGWKEPSDLPYVWPVK